MNSAIISLIIMGLCMILFITETFPASVTAMLGCVLMVLFKVCGLSDVLYGFTSDTILLFFSLQILSSAMFSSGAATIIGTAIVKLSQNDERKLVLISCVVSTILSAFLTNTAVIALMLAICNGVVSVNKEIKLKNIAIPVAIGAIFGGGLTLVGSTGQLTATGILEELTGQSIKMFTMTPICLILSILAIAYAYFIGYPMGKKIWGNEDKSEDYTPTVNLDTVKDKKKAYLIMAIFGSVIIMFFTNIITPGIAAIIGALLCIMTKTISHKEAYSGIDWNVTLWLSCCLGLARALNISGGSQMIAEFFINQFAGLSSPFLFFAAIVLISLVLSQFIANLTAIVILLPPALIAAQAMGANPLPFAIGITIGAGFTFVTPLANGFIGMTMSAGYKFTDYFKYGLLLTTVTYILCLILIPMFYPF